ncbi:hypothetical protein QE152_g41543, partial [Popillia japonica]
MTYNLNIDKALEEPELDENNVNTFIAQKKTKVEEPTDTGFTILGGEKFNKNIKVKRVLPKWLANPTVVSTNLQNLNKKVSSLKELDKKLRKCLKNNGIKYLFPVQAEVIPWLLQSHKCSDIVFPRDICV